MGHSGISFVVEVLTNTIILFELKYLLSVVTSACVASHSPGLIPSMHSSTTLSSPFSTSFQQPPLHRTLNFSNNSKIEHRTTAILTEDFSLVHFPSTNSSELSSEMQNVTVQMETSSLRVPTEHSMNDENVLYDLDRRPLTCEDIIPYLKKNEFFTCHYKQAQKGALPEVTCEVAVGFQPVAGSYNKIFHYTSTYQVSDRIMSEGKAVEDGLKGRCIFPTSVTVEKADKLSDVAHLRVVTEANPFQDARANGSAGGGQWVNIPLPLLSHGFRELRMDFGRSGWGADGCVAMDTHCPSCPPEVWLVHYGDAELIQRLLINRARLVFMRFTFVGAAVATWVLHRLVTGALLEEVAVHGGQRWTDSVILPVSLPLLRRLDLAGNGLDALSPTNFHRTPNLLHLNLSDNYFSELPSGIGLLHRLRTLMMSGNPITKLQFVPVFRTLTKLQEINLSGAPLGNLDCFVTDSSYAPGNITRTLPDKLYSRLEVLDVSGCNVSSLETVGARSLWARAGSLRALRLADNPLASVPPWLAQRLPALQELDLSGCLLAAPPALRLAPAQRLRRLLLARNLLATPRGALASGGGAGGGAAYLDVSGNPLRGEWGAGAFAPLGARASVNLSRTQLTALSPQMLRSLQPLAQVDLGGNAFDCSACSTPRFKEWLLNTSRPEVVLLGAPGAVECASPFEARGRPVAEWAWSPRAECLKAPLSVGEGNAGAVAGAGVAGALLVAAILALLAFRFRLHLVYVLHVLRANRALKGAALGLHAQFEFDAFVCYSKHDRQWVLNELLPQLEGNHPTYRLCLHERDFPLGALVVQNIVECMERSRRTLMVLTPSFVQSQWCQWELEMATHRLLEGARRDFLVLVELQRLEARALPRLLRLLVESRTFLQWPPAEGSQDEAWKRLRAALGRPLQS